MAFPQVFCPSCGKHLSPKARTKTVGGTGRMRVRPLGAVYLCSCGAEFGWRRGDGTTTLVKANAARPSGVS